MKLLRTQLRVPVTALMLLSNLMWAVHVRGVELIKSNSGADSLLSLAANYYPSQVPTINDPIVFNNLITAATTFRISNVANSNLSVGGLTVINPAGAITLQNSNSQSQTLTLGSGGIDMSRATQNLTLSSATGGTLTLALAGAGSGNWKVAAGRTLAVGAVISGTTGLTINPSMNGLGGTVTLSGANTFTGATSVANSTLNLDFASAGNRIHSGSALTLTRSTLNLQGTGATVAQTVNGLTLGSGFNQITRTAGSSTINVGAITRSDNSLLNIGTAGVVTTSNANVNGILGGWAVLGKSDWATGGGAIGAFTAYTAKTGAWTAPGATANVRIDGSVTGVTTDTINSLKFNGAFNLTQTGGTTLNIASGGILKNSATDTTISGGTITAGGVANGSADTLYVWNNANNMIVSSVFANNGGDVVNLVKAGDSTLRFDNSAAHTMTGTVTISGGRILIGNGNTVGTLPGTNVVFAIAPGAAAGTATDDGMLVYNRTDAATWTQNLTGVGGDDASRYALRKVANSAVLTLTPTVANTYFGGTNIQGGTLTAGNTTAFSPNSKFQLSNTAGVVLNLNNFNNAVRGLTGGGTTGGNVTLGSGTLTIAPLLIDTLSFAGVISGAGGVTKSGEGSQTFTAGQTFTGPLTVNAGTLTGTTFVPSSVIMNGGTLTATTITPAGGTALTINGGTLQATTINATTVDILNGTLRATVAATGAINMTGSGRFVMGAGSSLPANATVNLSGAGASLELMNGGNFTIGSFTSGAQSRLGVDPSGASTTVTFNNDTGNHAIDGVLSGALNVIKGASSTSTWLLSGGNSYTGPTVVNAGGLVRVPGTAVEVLPDVTALNLAASGTFLTLNNQNETIGSLAGVAGTTVDAGTGILTTGGNNATTAFAGTLLGAGGLVKAGTGTMALSGNNSGFSGAISVAQGGLTLDSALSGSNKLSLGAGAVLNINVDQTVGSISGVRNSTLNLAAGTTLTSTHLSPVRAAATTLDSSIVDVVGVGTSGLTPGMAVTGPGIAPNTTVVEVLGPNQVKLSSKATVTQAGTDLAFSLGLVGNTDVNTRVVQITGAGGTTKLLPGMAVTGDSIPADTYIVQVLSENEILINQNIIGSQADANLSFEPVNLFTQMASNLAGAGNWTKLGTGKVVLSGQNTMTGTLTIGDGIMQVGGIASNGRSYFQDILSDAGAIVFGPTAAAPVWSSGTGYAIGTTVTVQGTGTVDGRVYRAIANHTGAATTQPGVGVDWQTSWREVAPTLNFANNVVNLTPFERAGSIAGPNNAGAVVNLSLGTSNSILALGSNNTSTSYNGRIEGTAAAGLIKEGAGTFTWINSDLTGFAGTIRIEQGGFTATGTQGLDVNSNVVLSNRPGATFTSDVVNGDLVSFISGGGRGTTRTFPNGLQGALLGNYLGATGGEIVTVKGLTVNNTTANAVFTYGGIISGAGSFTKQGASILELRGTSTYTGATVIESIVDNTTSRLRLGAYSGGAGVGSVGAGGFGSLPSGSRLVMSGGNVGQGRNVAFDMMGATQTLDTIVGVNAGIKTISFDGGTLNINTTTSLSSGFFDGTFSGNATINVNATLGTNGWDLRGNSNATQSGSLNVNGGRVTLNGQTPGIPGTLGDSVHVKVASGATLAVAVGDTIGSLSGAGSLILTQGLTLTSGVKGSTTANPWTGISSGAGGIGLNTGANLRVASNQGYTGATTLSDRSIFWADYSGGASNIIPGSLVMNGGSLVLNGNTTTDIVSQTTIGPGASSIAAAVAGDTSRIGLGNITRNTGGVLNVKGASAATSTSPLSSGILGGYATYGAGSSATTWAVPNGAGTAISGLPSSAYSDEWAFGKNTDVRSNMNVSGDTETLRFDTAGAFVVTLDDYSIIDEGGILVTPNVGANDVTIGSGNSPFGVQLIGGMGVIQEELIVHQHNPLGRLLMDVVVDNFTGNTTFVKAGQGRVVLMRDNFYSAATMILGGVLQVGNGGATGTMSNSSSSDITNHGYLAFNRSDTNLVIPNNISGTGAVRIEGTGAITLAGISNSYTGSTSVISGTLNVANTNNGLGSAEGGTTVAPGATLNLTNISGINEPILLKGSTLSANGISALTGFLRITGNSDLKTTTSKTDVLTLAGPVVADPGIALTVSGIGTTIFTNTQNQFDQITVQTIAGQEGPIVGRMQVGNNSAGSLGRALIINNGVVTTNTNDGHFILRNLITGTGGFTQTRNTVYMTADNTYSGLTRVGGNGLAEGTQNVNAELRIGNDTFTGSLGTGQVLIQSSTGGNSAVRYHLLRDAVINNNFTINPHSDGTTARNATLLRQGLGTITLAGTITAGLDSASNPQTQRAVLQSEGGGRLIITGTINNGISNRLNIVNNGIVEFGGSVNNTYFGVLSGNNVWVFNNSGTTTLNGRNTFNTSNMYIQRGTLVINEPGDLLAATPVLPDGLQNDSDQYVLRGATLQFNHSETIGAMYSQTGATLTVAAGKTLTIDDNTNHGQFGRITGAGSYLFSAAGGAAWHGLFGPNDFATNPTIGSLTDTTTVRVLDLPNAGIASGLGTGSVINMGLFGSTEESRLEYAGVGNLASRSTNRTIQLNGTVATNRTVAEASTNSTTVKLSSVTGLLPGVYVTGTGIPAGIQVVKVDAGTNTVTLTSAVSLAVDAPLAFERASAPSLTKNAGATATNSNTLIVSDLGALTTGMTIRGAGIPAGVTITAINTATKALTLSANVTVNNATPLLFNQPNTLARTASATSNSSTTLNLADVSGLFNDMVVTGPGIPAGTIITAVGSNSVTLNNNASVPTNSAIFFGYGANTTTRIAGSGRDGLILNGDITPTNRGNQTLMLHGQNIDNVINGKLDEAGVVMHLSVNPASGNNDLYGNGRWSLTNAGNNFSGNVDIDLGGLELAGNLGNGTGTTSVLGDLTATRTISLGAINFDGRRYDIFGNGDQLGAVGSSLTTLSNTLELRSATGSIIFKDPNNGTATLGSNITFTQELNSTGSNPGAARIVNDGAKVIVINGALTSGVNGDRPWVLDGSNTGTNTINGVISTGGSNIVSLQKQGAGTWRLAGANTFTGGVTITRGTLEITGGSTISDAATVNLTNAGSDGLSTGLARFNVLQSETIGSLQGAVGSVTDIAAGHTLTVTNATDTYNGQITGGGGFTRRDNGTLRVTTLTNKNTYTGPTTVFGTALGNRIDALWLADGGSASSIGSASNSAANLILNTGTGNGGLRFIGLGNQSTDRLFTIGAGAGAANIWADGLLLGDVAPTVRFSNTGAIAFLAPNTAQTLTLRGNTISDNRFDPQITNNGSGVTSLVKSENSIWLLTNTNSFTGGTTIGAGTLAINNGGALGSGTINVTGGGGAGLQLRGGITVNTPITITGADGGINALSGANVLSGVVTLNAQARITVDAGASLELNNASGLAGTGVLWKAGNGILTLSGPLNANRTGGNTLVSGGTLKLDFNASNSNRLPTAGILQLGWQGSGGFTGLGSDNNVKGQTNQFGLSGGKVELSGGNFVQVAASSNVNIGANAVTRASGTSTLRLNAITRAAGGTIDFNFTTGSSVADTDTNNINNIIGGIGYATINKTDWAQSIASGAADTAITAFSGYNADSYSATNNVDVVTFAAPGTLAANTLRFNQAAGGTLNLAGTFAFSGGGVLMTPNSGNVILTGGTIRNAAVTANLEAMVIHQHSASGLQIDSVLANNTAAQGLTKSGTGKVFLNAVNTITGTLNLNEGELQVGGTIAAPTTATNAMLGVNNAINISSGAILKFLSNSATLQDTGTIQGGGEIILAPGNSQIVRLDTDNPNYFGDITISGGILEILSQNNALGVNRGITTINGGGTLRINDNRSTGEFITMNEGAVISTLAAATAATLSGKQTLNNTTSAGATYNIAGGSNLTVSGIIATSNGFTKTGNGILTVSANQMQSFLEGAAAGATTPNTNPALLGQVIVAQGEMRLGNPRALGATGFGNETIVNAGASLDLRNQSLNYGDDPDPLHELIRISGTGLNNTGALRNTSGTGQFSHLGLDADATISAGGFSNGSRLELSTYDTNPATGSSFDGTFTRVRPMIVGGGFNLTIEGSSLSSVTTLGTLAASSTAATAVGVVFHQPVFTSPLGALTIAEGLLRIDLDVPPRVEPEVNRWTGLKSQDITNGLTIGYNGASLTDRTNASLGLGPNIGARLNLFNNWDIHHTVNITMNGELAASKGGVNYIETGAGTIPSSRTFLDGAMTLTGPAANNVFSIDSSSSNQSVVEQGNLTSSIQSKLIVGGVIGGAGGFTKTGYRELRLTNGNTFTGDVNVLRFGTVATAWQTNTVNINGVDYQTLGDAEGWAEWGLTLNGANGTLGGTGNINLQRRGMITLDNTTRLDATSGAAGFVGGNNNNRINDAANVLFNHGWLRINGGTTDNTEQLATALGAKVQVLSGTNILDLYPTDGANKNMTLTIGAMTRSPGAVLRITNLDSTSTFGTTALAGADSVRVALGSADGLDRVGSGATLTSKPIVVGVLGGTIPHALGQDLRMLGFNNANVSDYLNQQRNQQFLTGSHFMTYDNGFLRPLDDSEYFIPGTGLINTADGAANQNVALTDAFTIVNENTTINSLRFGPLADNNGSGGALNSGTTLTSYTGGYAAQLYVDGTLGISSGMISSAYFTVGNSSSLATIIMGGNLDFGAKEAIINNQNGMVRLTDGVVATGGLDIRSNIMGTGGLLKTGLADVNLDGRNSYSGVTTISDGVLRVRNGRQSLGAGRAAGDPLFDAMGRPYNGIVLEGNGQFITDRGIQIGSPTAMENILVKAMQGDLQALRSENDVTNFFGNVIIDNVDAAGQALFTPRISAVNTGTLIINGNITGGATSISNDVLAIDSRRVSFNSSSNNTFFIRGQIGDKMDANGNAIPIADPISTLPTLAGVRTNENEVLRVDLAAPGNTLDTSFVFERQYNAAGRLTLEAGNIFINYAPDALPANDRGFWTNAAISKIPNADSTTTTFAINGGTVQQGFLFGTGGNQTSTTIGMIALFLTQPGQVFNMATWSAAGDGRLQSASRINGISVSGFDQDGSKFVGGTNETGTVTFGTGNGSLNISTDPVRLYANSGGTVVFNQRMAGSVGFVKIGRGTVELQNTGVNSASDAPFELSGGKLILNMAGQNVARVAGTATFNGGTLRVQNNLAAASTASLTTALSFAAGGSEVIAESRSGFGMTVAMGGTGVTMLRNPGATTNLVEYLNGGTAAQVTLNFATTTASATLSNVIPWATYGTTPGTALDFAMSDPAAAGDVRAFNRAAGDYNTNVASWTAGQNVSENVGAGFVGTLPATTTVNTVRFDSPSNNVVTIADAKTLRLQGNNVAGAMMVSSNTGIANKTISGGALSALHSSDTLLTADILKKDFTGTTTASSTTISNVNTAGLVVGMQIVGKGISSNTTITAINAGNGTITLSANATASASDVALTGFLITNVPSTSILIVGMPIFGQNIAPNSVITALTANSILVSQTPVAAINGVSLAVPLMVSGSITVTGNTTLNSKSVYGVSSTTNLSVGFPITGTNIAADTRISSVSLKFNGNTTNNSASVTNISAVQMATLVAGMPVTGSGIPAGTTIQSISLPSTITLSANATATGTNVELTVPNAIQMTNGALATAAGTSITMPVLFQGNTTVRSTSVTGLLSTSALAVGMPVYGDTIPANTFITALSATTITLSNAALSSTTALQFFVVPDLIVHQYGLGALTIDSQITGNNSLTIAGPATNTADTFGTTGKVVLTNTNNSYGGRTYVNGAILEVSDPRQLGANPVAAINDQISLNGGTLRFTGTTGDLGNRGVTLQGGGGVIDVTQGNGSLMIGSVLPLAGGQAQAQIAAQSQNSNSDVYRGDLVKIGAGNLTLAANAAASNNSFQGQLDVRQGSLTLMVDVGDAATGTTSILGSNRSWVDGTIFRNGTNLQAFLGNGNGTGDWNIEEFFTFEGNNVVTYSGLIDIPPPTNLGAAGALNGQFNLGNRRPLNLNGPINFAGNTTFDVGPFSNVRFNLGGGYLTGSGDIIKDGQGQMEFRGNVPDWKGGLVIKQGLVYAINQGDMLGTGYATGKTITLGDSARQGTAQLLIQNPDGVQNWVFDVKHDIDVVYNPAQTKRLGIDNVANGNLIAYSGNITLNDNLIVLLQDGGISAGGEQSVLNFNGSLKDGVATSGNIVFQANSGQTNNSGANGRMVAYAALNGNNSLWTGDLSISANTSYNQDNTTVLRLGNSQALTAANDVLMNFNSMLQVGGQNVTVGSLTTAGGTGPFNGVTGTMYASGTGNGSTEVIENAAATPGTLTISQATPATFEAVWDAKFQNGTINSEFFAPGTNSNQPSAALSLVKSGPGWATLSLDNDYTGTTVVAGGVLQVGRNGVGDTGFFGPSIAIGSAAASTDVITTAAPHGLSVNNSVEFHNLAGGSGLTNDVVYYVSEVVSPTSFKLSLQPAGVNPANITVDYTASVGSVRQPPAGGTTVNAAATLAGTGLVQGGLTVQSGAFVKPGDAAGNAMGTLTVSGNAIFSAGSAALMQVRRPTYNNPNYLDSTNALYSTWRNSVPTDAFANALIELPTTAQHDHVDVLGTINWAIGSKVSLVDDGYVPAAGDVFNLFDMTGVAGNIDVGPALRVGDETGTDLDLFALGGNFRWDTSLFNTHGILLVVTAEASSAVAKPVITSGLTISPSAVVDFGAQVTLSVVANGPGQLTYEWRRNKVVIATTNTNSYSFTAQSTDSGTYDVLVSNAGGLAVSAEATLTVTDKPIISQQPASQTVNPTVVPGPVVTATFTVVASGLGNLTYQWRKNGQNIPGATSSSYTTPAVTEADEGTIFDVVVSNAFGDTTSNPATLSVNDPVTNVVATRTLPVPPTLVYEGDVLELTVTAQGTGPFQYQWFRNDSPIAGNAAKLATYRINSVASNSGGAFRVVVTGATGASNAVTSNIVNVQILPAAPFIANQDQPVSQMVRAGDPLVLTVAASGRPPLQYQWKKGTTASAPNIPGATGPVFTIPVTTTASNGSYICVVTNPNLPASVASKVAKVGIVDDTPKTIVAAVGATATLTATVTGPADVTPFTYQWLKNDQVIAGATAKTLSLKPLSLADTATYTCRVFGYGDNATGCTHFVRVYDKAALIAGPVTMPRGIVGAAYGANGLGFEIPLKDNENFDRTATTYSATGLPTGLKVDTKTGKISGIPTKPGTFTITLKVANTIKPTVAEAPLATVVTTLVIDGMPAGSVGVFAGPIPRNAINSDLVGGANSGLLGGRFDLTTTAVGGYTGKVTLGTVSYAIKGALLMTARATANDTIANPTATATIVRKGLTNLVVTFNINYATNRISVANISDGITPPVSFVAWRNVWDIKSISLSSCVTNAGSPTVVCASTAALKVGMNVVGTGIPLGAKVLAINNATSFDLSVNATATTTVLPSTLKLTADFAARSYAGLHTFALDLADGDVGNQAIPQGVSYGSFTVVNAGTLTIAGKLSDDEALTGGAFVGPDGEILIFKTLYTTPTKGSVVGYLDIDVAADINANTLTGVVTWSRPVNPSLTHRVYKAGFGPITLMGVGGRYVEPIAPTLVLGIAGPGVNAAQLRFLQGGIGNPPPKPDVNLDVAALNKFTVNGANPRSTKLTTVNAKTGAFSGAFTLVDANPVPPPASITRAVTFQGVIVREAGEWRGYGYFLLPAFSTSTTSPKLSGLVIFQQPPPPVPTIDADPVAVVVNPGAAASFTVAASGVVTSYQWRKNGIDIPGANAATYTIDPVAETDEGSFTVVVSNSGGSATSNAATLQVNDPVSNVVAVRNPADAEVFVGTEVVFSVTASGTGPFSYQWRKDGEDIVGATGATFTIPAAAEEDTAGYTVVVRNVVPGSVTSNVVPLSVVTPP